MASQTFVLELFPENKVTLALFTDVDNCLELKKKIVEGKIDGALLSASMIVDVFQVLVAANKAIHLNHYGKMKTRNINSEILFNLSPTNNITDSFKKFGINEDDNTILVAVIDDNNGEKLRDITQCIDGTRMELNELQICTDIGKIKKVYKIQDTELKQSSLLDAVVCRMATKDAS